MTLKFYSQSPQSGKSPTSMVILLHGLGSNGQDLMGLVPYWQSMLPDTVFISPDAPFRCDMAPMGYQWFSLQNWSPRAILEGASDVAPMLQDFITEMLAKYNLPDEKLVLVGFSQGTMMSLYAGPRREHKIAGVLAYSGALLGAETLGDLHIHKVLVHLVHGDMDMVVPLGAYHMALDALESNGFTVTGGITNGLAHSIDLTGIRDGGEFMKTVLS